MAKCVVYVEIAVVMRWWGDEKQIAASNVSHWQFFNRQTGEDAACRVTWLVAVTFITAVVSLIPTRVLWDVDDWGVSASSPFHSTSTSQWIVCFVQAPVQWLVVIPCTDTSRSGCQRLNSNVLAAPSNWSLEDRHLVCYFVRTDILISGHFPSLTVSFLERALCWLSIVNALFGSFCSRWVIFSSNTAVCLVYGIIIHILICDSSSSDDLVPSCLLSASLHAFGAVFFFSLGSWLQAGGHGKVAGDHDAGLPIREEEVYYPWWLREGPQGIGNEPCICYNHSTTATYIDHSVTWKEKTTGCPSSPLTKACKAEPCLFSRGDSVAGYIIGCLLAVNHQSCRPF